MNLYPFPPTYRLRKTDEFSSVFAFRRTLKGDFFILHHRATGQAARLGVVVAKKLLPHAVQRNLVKRLAREAFRHCRDTLPRQDVILRLARPAKAVPKQALRQDIDRLFKRLSALQTQ